MMPAGLIFLIVLVAAIASSVGFAWAQRRRLRRECYHNGHLWTTDGDGLYCRNCGQAPQSLTFQR